MEEMLDLLPGSVSIMGLANDTEHRVQLVIDREVLEGEYLGCHPCMNTSSIKLKTKDVLEKFLPAVRHTRHGGGPALARPGRGPAWLKTAQTAPCARLHPPRPCATI